MYQNLYLNILEFGVNNIGNPITKEDLFKHLKIDFTKKDFNKFTIDNIFRRIYEQIEDVPAKYIITIDAYFQYLEHIRLEEARKDTKKAIIISIVAIIISIILAFIQILKC